MEKYELKKENIKFHNIVFSVTSNMDYEMERFLLLEDLEGVGPYEFVVVEGYHCSCYDFDDCKWEAVLYSVSELIEIAKDRAQGIDFYLISDTEKNFYKLVLSYLTYKDFNICLKEC